MIKIYHENNYFFVIVGTILFSGVKSNWEFRERDGKFSIYLGNRPITGATNLVLADFIDENDDPFSDELALRDFYTQATGIGSYMSVPSGAMDVNVLNPVSVGGVETLLNSVISELNAIDTNTTNEETLLTQIRNEVTATGGVNNTNLLNAITAINTVQAETAPLEALLQSIVTNTTSAGVYGYVAGTAGTVVLSGSKKVQNINVTAAAGVLATVQINGGAILTVLAGIPMNIPVNSKLIDPTIIITGLGCSYFIDYLV